jgi:hypothetical protein
MFMARRAMQVTINESDHRELERWVSAHRTPQQVAQRCRIILAAANSQQDKDIAESMAINAKTVALWRQRFCREGPDCLWEVAAGRGRKPQFTADKIEESTETQRSGGTLDRREALRGHVGTGGRGGVIQDGRWPMPAAALGIRGDVRDARATAPLRSLPYPPGVRKVGAGVVRCPGNVDEGVEERHKPPWPRRASARTCCRSRACSCSKRSMASCVSQQTAQQMSAINPSGE